MEGFPSDALGFGLPQSHWTAMSPIMEEAANIYPVDSINPNNM